MRRTALTVLLALLLNTTTACAAGRHLKQARSAQVRGDAIAAQHHFEQALRHRDKLAEDDGFKESLRLATRDAEVTRGRAAMDQRQYRAAANHFDRALEQEGISGGCRGLLLGLFAARSEPRRQRDKKENWLVQGEIPAKKGRRS